MPQSVTSDQPSIPTGSKLCRRCKQVKPLLFFQARRDRAGGRQAQCAICHIEWHAAYVKTVRGRAAMLRNAARTRCKSSGVYLDLPLQWVIDRLTPGVCELTGIKFDYEPLGTSLANPYSPSIDRIDPAMGYTVGNCRVILTAMNRALSSYGTSVFERIATAYLANK